MIKAKAIRTNCISGVEKEIEITVERVWEESLISWWIRIDKGGVTGYESIEISEKNIEATSLKGWWACMGTKGRWDGLLVPAKEMKKIFDELERKETEEDDK